MDLAFSPGTDYGVNSLAIQLDGKILVGGNFSTLAGQPRSKIGRLNNTGPATHNLSYDGSTLLWQRGGTSPEVWRTTFEVTTNSLNWTSLGAGTRIPGGWQLSGVSLPAASTVRARGFANSGYQNSSSWFLEDYWGKLVVAYQPSGRTNDAGTTATFNVVAGGTEPVQYRWFKDGVALSDGGLISGAQTATLTLSNVLKADEGAYRVVITNSSGSITSAIARLTVIDPLINSQPTNQVAKLNGSTTLSVVAAGTALRYQWLKEGLPLAFATNANLELTNLQLVDAGRYAVVVSNQFGNVTSAVAVLTVNGVTADLTFNPGAGGDYSSVNSLAIQPDGKILVGGSFTTLDGQARTNLGRLNDDGTLDTAFKPWIGTYYGSVNSLAVQADGKILVGGSFDTIGGQPRNNLGRLNVDGSVDMPFNPVADGSVSSIAMQADGKIVVAGGFTTLGGQARTNIGRLLADGGVDSAFNPGTDGWVSSVALQADGKILIGGGFTMVAGQPRNYIGRLNADGTLDTGFNPAIGPSYGSINSLAVQADGKILVSGSFGTIGGQPRNNIGRLNADGSVDMTFNPGDVGSVSCIVLQTDGRILLSGYFTSLGGLARNNIGRLNADGSVDLNFNPTADGSVSSMAVQPDGKILVGGYFSTLGGQPRTNFGRLNNTGPATHNLSYDGSTLLWQRGGTSPEVWRTAFEVTTNSLNWISLGAGTRVPGGWQLSGASLPAASTVRARGFANSGYQNSSSWFLEDYWGDVLAAYQPLSRTNNAGTTAAFSIVAGGTGPLQYQWFKDGVALSDGGAVSGAQAAILTLNSVLKANEGNYTVLITNASSRVTSAVARLTVVDPFINSQPTNQLAELHGDATLSVGAAGTALKYQWFKGGLPLAAAVNSALSFTNLQLADAGHYSVVVSNQFGSVTSSVVALTVNGATTDPTFNPGADSVIDSMAIQPDGKILVGGNFTTFGGQTRNRIGRLNDDGTLDMTFNPGTDGEVLSLAVQTDGKILVGGVFLALNGRYIYGLGRLNSDGTLDTSFNPAAGTGVYSLVIQPDEKILVGGGFYSLGGQPRSYIGRLNANGTLDTGFNPDANSSVLSMAIQADGKILIGGHFTILQGQDRYYLGRLNPNGTLDTTFNPGADGPVQSLAVQADGKILVGGYFTTLAGQPRNNLGRLNADGSLDTAFRVGTDGAVSSIALQANGKILVGGGFSTLGGSIRTNLARLNADGSVDLNFNPIAEGWVSTVGLQADGEILVGGFLSTLGGQTRAAIGRLNNTEQATENFAYDGATLLWQRGGASPEVWRTTFEVTTNSVDWTSLGAGTRVSGGWQLTGVSLPAYSRIRTRGFVIGDGYGVSSWFVESFWSPGPDLEAALGRAVVGVGTGGCVPLYLSSRYGLTNLSIVVDFPAGHLTNFTIQATALEVGTSAIELVGTNRAVITLSAKPGFVLHGSAQVAWLCFDVSSGHDSSFVELEGQEIFGVRNNGFPVEYTQIRSGQVAAVGQSPLLECVRGNNGLPLLILHGQPGGGYDIQAGPGDGTWTTVWTNLSLTDYSLALPAPAVNGPVTLFRAIRTGQ